MSSPFYQMLKRFIWPRYREEGPPSHIDSFFFDKECLDSDGNIKEPVKSILEIKVLGYRPVTVLSILGLLIENQNRPMYGAQIGKELERRFQLSEGWFTKTRYYDTRIGKMLKILRRLDILEETEVADPLTKKRYLGYCIAENIHHATRKRILNFMHGGTLSIFETRPSPQLLKTKEAKTVKRCTGCKTLTTSLKAQYCELCGKPLNVVCPICKRENSLEYIYCLHCGKKVRQ